MALVLKQIFTTGSDEIAQNYIIESWHVSQSVDAFTGAAAYDITISGSLTLTGSVQSQNGFTGSLLGTAATASKATQIVVSSSVSSTNQFLIPFISNTANGYPNYAGLLVDSGSDNSGLWYNPSTNTLSASVFFGTASYVATASQALTASYAVTGSDFFVRDQQNNFSQGTLYTKFENIFASQSSIAEYNLLAATTTFDGSTILTNTYCNNNSTQPRVLKFHLNGYIAGNHTAGPNPTLDSYVKIGSTILASTQLGTAGSISLQGADAVPFELDYELIFVGQQVYACGGIGYCKNGDYKKYALANLYTPNAATSLSGLLQFVVSGSSDIIITGSLGFVETLN